MSAVIYKKLPTETKAFHIRDTITTVANQNVLHDYHL